MNIIKIILKLIIPSNDWKNIPDSAVDFNHILKKNTLNAPISEKVYRVYNRVTQEYRWISTEIDKSNLRPIKKQFASTVTHKIRDLKTRTTRYVTFYKEGSMNPINFFQVYRLFNCAEELVDDINYLINLRLGTLKKDDLLIKFENMLKSANPNEYKRIVNMPPDPENPPGKLLRWYVGKGYKFRSEKLNDYILGELPKEIITPKIQLNYINLPEIKPDYMLKKEPVLKQINPDSKKLMKKGERYADYIKRSMREKRAKLNQTVKDKVEQAVKDKVEQDLKNIKGGYIESCKKSQQVRNILILSTIIISIIIIIYKNRNKILNFYYKIKEKVKKKFNQIFKK